MENLKSALLTGFAEMAGKAAVIILIIIGLVVGVIGMIWISKFAIDFFRSLILPGGMTEAQAMKSMENTEWAGGVYNSNFNMDIESKSLYGIDNYSADNYDTSAYENPWDDGAGGDYRD